MATYGVELLTSGSTPDTKSGSDQVCDRVWILNMNVSSNAPYFLIAASGPADANDFRIPYQKMIGPFSVTNTNKLHFYFPNSGTTVRLMWMTD